MAKIEKIVTVRVKNNLFDFEDIVSFRTKNYVGEFIGEYADGIEGMREFIIFNTKSVRYISDRTDRVYANDLDDLMNEVEFNTGEEIIEVYDGHIATINTNIPM